MKNEFKSAAGMIFHPPNLKSVEEAMFCLYPVLAPIYKNVSDYNKKQAFLKIPPFEFFKIKDVKSKTNTTASFTGIMLPLLPEQFLTNDHDFIRGKILKSLNLAHKKGVGIITLGSFTSIATDQGVDLVTDVKTSITSGNTYTTAVCIKSILKICDLLELDMKSATLSIVGATGDIGGKCAFLLSKYFGETILCSRSITEESSVVNKIRTIQSKKCIIEKNPQNAVSKADVIISATSSISPLFKKSDLKRGAVLCDISVPSNLSSDFGGSRKDIVAYQGGRAKFVNYDQISNRAWKVLFPNNSIYGCLVESLILAFENKIESYSLGSDLVDEVKMEEIYNLGVKHGFSISEFEGADCTYTKNDLIEIKKLRKTYAK